VSEHYNRGAITLHWVTAALIVANLLLGLSMVALPISPRKLHWYLFHKSIGITIFLLTSLRIAWRTIRPHPEPVPMPRWQRRAARASHALLYVLLFVIPLSGWLYSSATGVQVVYLGLVPLPDLLGKDKALGDALRIVHVGLNSLLFAVVCLHVAAAIKHHFIDRDAALIRMLPIVKTARVR
jgi:cytochrome b561